MAKYIQQMVPIPYNPPLILTINEFVAHQLMSAFSDVEELQFQDRLLQKYQGHLVMDYITGLLQYGDMIRRYYGHLDEWLYEVGVGIESCFIDYNRGFVVVSVEEGV